MQHLVNLDVLASRLLPAMREWRRWAAVGPLTWRDEAVAWPQPITSDRPSVHVRESLGFTLRKHGSDDEFEAVVWTGGWADVEYVLRGEVHALCPEFRDVGGAYYAVTMDVEDFLAEGDLRARVAANEMT